MSPLNSTLSGFMDIEIPINCNPCHYYVAKPFASNLPFSFGLHGLISSDQILRLDFGKSPAVHHGD